MKNIDGWLHESVMHYVGQISEIQRSAGINGHVVEIGVHHGKFFIPMALLNKTGTNIAVDLFENQEENVSQSGKGNLNMFNSHCEEYKVPNVVIISGNSLTLTAEPFCLDGTGVRLFSVDGGHFEKEVMNDLNIAKNCLLSGGVIIVDDFQHPGWDDVFTTTMQFLKNNPGIKPFLMGGNKLFLCHEDVTLYDNLRNTLTWNQYNQINAPYASGAQMLKAKTLFQLYPVQLFEETKW